MKFSMSYGIIVVLKAKFVKQLPLTLKIIYNCTCLVDSSMLKSVDDQMTVECVVTMQCKANWKDKTAATVIHCIEHGIKSKNIPLEENCWKEVTLSTKLAPTFVKLL